jgi:hypothetical protein
MKRKILIIGIILLIVLIVMYFYFRMNKSTTSTDQSNNMNINESDFPIVYGDRNDTVKKLQMYLNHYAYLNPKLAIDGVFGNNTLAASRRFLGVERVTLYTWLSNNIENIYNNDSIDIVKMGS